jgi:hypothetical protein
MLGLGLGLNILKSRSIPSGGIQGNRWDDPDTFFTSVVTRGGVGITGSLYSDADSFFTATIGVDGGPQTITANLYNDADSFFASTVNSTYPATGDFYQDPDTFFTATVSLSGASGATLDPAAKGAGWTLSGGDLIATRNATASGTHHTVRSTTGKGAGVDDTFFEVTVTSQDVSSGDLGVGIVDGSAGLTTYIGVDSHGASHRWDGFIGFNGGSATGVAFAQGDVIGCWAKRSANELRWYKNGVQMNSAIDISFLSGTIYAAIDSGFTSSVATVNFGGTAFAYTPPTGATAWG